MLQNYFNSKRIFANNLFCRKFHSTRFTLCSEVSPRILTRRCITLSDVRGRSLNDKGLKGEKEDTWTVQGL